MINHNESAIFIAVSHCSSSIADAAFLGYLLYGHNGFMPESSPLLIIEPTIVLPGATCYSLLTSGIWYG
jgi:hypothetical protein